MRHAAREIPQVADAHVVDEIIAILVNRGDAGADVKHVGPFGLLLPMQFADTAGVQPHLDACQSRGDAELALSDLPRPAAVGLACMRIRKRKTQVRQRPLVRRRRIEHVGIFSVAREIAWAWVASAKTWSAIGLWHLRARLPHGRGGCGQKSASSTDGKNVTT